MMPILYMLKGLPAAGKSTRCNDWEMRRARRANKDDLRALVDNGLYEPDRESLIREVNDTILRVGLIAGFDVVDDNTNVRPERELQLRNLANECGAEFRMIFVDTPLDVCIQRDRQRLRPVGEEAIRRLHAQLVGEPAAAPEAGGGK